MSRRCQRRPSMNARRRHSRHDSYMSPSNPADTPSTNEPISGPSAACYEMLTGRPSFAGETISDTLAAVLKQEPDWQALPADTPPGIRSLLRRCLRKDPVDRLHDIADARIEIQEAIAEPAAMTPTGPQPRAARWTRMIPWVVAAGRSRWRCWSCSRARRTGSPPAR